MDPRCIRLADLVLDYSLEVKEGQSILLMSEVGAEPLIQALIAGASRRGVFVLPVLRVTDAQYLFFANATESLIDGLPAVQRQIYETVDGLVSILATGNPRELTRVDPARLARSQRARGPLSEIINRREQEGSLKWVIAPFPTNALASEAEMSLSEYADFVFRACACDDGDPVVHWRTVEGEQERLIAGMSGARRLHVTGPETDIIFDVEGRTWVNCCGKRNMPDGEIFTSPVESKTEGHIFFDYPAVYRGVEVRGVRLRFEAGRVVEASAEKNEEYFLKMLDMDAGARFVGEVAIGTNFGVKSPTKEILFDEKIGGSMHMALGRAIPSAGGTNISALHWDLIKDMRQGGCWRLDGRVIYENGRFTL